MNTSNSQKLRWDPYFLRSGLEFISFWQDYLNDEARKILYVLGKGFDPRMCSGIEALLDTGGSGVRDCLLIDFSDSADSVFVSQMALVKQNLDKLNKLLKNRGKLSSKQVRMWSGDGPGRHRIGSRNAAGIFPDLSELQPYTDIVIDISAIPRGIYLSLIGKTLFLLDNARIKDLPVHIPNLHVVASEDAILDTKIRDDSIDDSASYIFGFGADLDMEATEEIPKVWMPILGEGQIGQLERIHTLVNPDEICPVLPSPSLNPRRGDELLLEYRELLFDQWRVEPKNIIYAAERNPFEAYRQIHQAVRQYNQALQPLGGCKTAVSATSSKLLSIGAMMATYELEKQQLSVGLAHVETQGYDLDEENIATQSELFTLWLAGECYES